MGGRQEKFDNEKLKKKYILTTCSSLLYISFLTSYFLFCRGDMLSNYAGHEDRFLHPLRP